ncbi:MAG: MFS transporter, partial [Hyphomicrobiaceae bacterium]
MKTSWPQVVIAVAAGYAVCFQLGKVPAALPLIGAEFGLSLWQRGVIVSSLSVLTAVSGIFIGLWANRYQAERTAVLALAIAVGAGVAGSYATDFMALLVTRLVEGLGYILAMAALPAVVSANAAPDDRPLALAFWGSTVPGGMAVLMLSSPLLMESAGLGWRGLWIVTAAAIGAIAILFFVSVRPQPAGKRVTAPPLADLKHAVRFSTVALVGLFILYSVQFLAVISFLPTLLVEQSDLAL